MVITDKTRPALALLLLALVPGAYSAIEATGELPIELARYFVGGGSLYSDLPDNFPEFEVPAGLQLMGSVDYGNSQALVLNSNLDPDEAQQSLLRAFIAAGGWMPMPAAPRAGQGGFVAAGTAAPGLQPLDLCHEELGTLNIDATLAATVVQVRRNLPAGNRTLGCAQQTQQRLMMRGDSTGIAALMPVLEMPADPAGAAPSMSGGTAGNARERVATVQLATDMDAEQLERHFAAQLQAQGWQQDAQYSGELTTGSSWLRSAADDRQLTGLLTVVANGEAQFAVTFRMMAN